MKDHCQVGLVDDVGPVKVLVLPKVFALARTFIIRRVGGFELSWHEQVGKEMVCNHAVGRGSNEI